MQFGVLTFVTDEGIGPAELGAALEHRGFESLFLAEHTHIPVPRVTLRRVAHRPRAYDVKNLLQEVLAKLQMLPGSTPWVAHPQWGGIP